MLHPRPHERESGEPLVEIRQLSCGYDKQQVLTGIDLRIMPGDFVGLLGPSGSGKTTLLRSMVGAVDIFDGAVLVNGASTARQRPRVGYVPQLETIDWNFPVTVREVVMMGRTMENPLFPWFRKAERQLADRMMERLSILHLADRHIRELSGGQQQRAFLARALVSDPALLLLDEPVSGLDIRTRDEVMHLLHDLNHEGVAIVITTHEINSVAVHLPWIVCLAGRIVGEGPPAEVITPELLRRTYGAEMPVIYYEGMPIVGESPHKFGRNGAESANGRPARDGGGIAGDDSVVVEGGAARVDGSTAIGAASAAPRHRHSAFRVAAAAGRPPSAAEYHHEHPDAGQPHDHAHTAGAPQPPAADAANAHTDAKPSPGDEAPPGGAERADV